MSKNWKIKTTDKSIVQSLAENLGVGKIVAQLLVLRGIITFDDAKKFFRPEFSHLHDPYLMKNMQEAVRRIENAIAKKRRF